MQKCCRGVHFIDQRHILGLFNTDVHAHTHTHTGWMYLLLDRHLLGGAGGLDRHGGLKRDCGGGVSTCLRGLHGAWMRQRKHGDAVGREWSRSGGGSQAHPGPTGLTRRAAVRLRSDNNNNTITSTHSWVRLNAANPTSQTPLKRSGWFINRVGLRRVSENKSV